MFFVKLNFTRVKPSEIQLEKKHALLAEEKNSSSPQRENPFRKAANERIVDLMYLLSLKVSKKTFFVLSRVNALGLMYQ